MRDGISRRHFLLVEVAIGLWQVVQPSLAPTRWGPPAPWCLVMWLSPVQPETGVLRKSFNVIVNRKGD